MKRANDNYPIDFVITWVDGSDPRWREERNRFCEKAESEANGESRYRDTGLLKYWFRGVEEFTPWVRNIYFVTCGHLPPWLKTDHPKLTVVKHSDFIPDKYLPTFNSNAIELNLHRIEGLSRRFVYFNDDVFPIRALGRDAFFKKGMARDMFIQSLLTPDADDRIISGIQFNDLAVTNKYFSKADFLRRYPGKYLSFEYGKYFFRNLYLLPVLKLTGFRSHHSAMSFNKKTFEELWELEPETLERTSSAKFRSDRDVNPYLMCQYQIMKGEFVPLDPDKRPYFLIGRDNERIEKTICDQKADLVCLNDTLAEIDFEKEKEFLSQCFEHILPKKSSFEV